MRASLGLESNDVQGSCEDAHMNCFELIRIIKHMDCYKYYQTLSTLAMELIY